MRRLRLAFALALVPLAATAAEESAFDLMFRPGTLDSVPAEDTLLYKRHLDVPDADTAEDESGELRLSLGTDQQAHLAFHAGEQFRTIGDFPASVGNPVGMFFAETVVADMARITQGSPFYIRNRIKDALRTPATNEAAEMPFGGATVPARVIVLKPFTNDPNAARMGGFENLTITATLSDEVPGWYHSFRAEVPGQYLSTLEAVAQ